MIGITVLSLLGYELFKSHQETANLQRENQELRQEIDSLKEKTSTSSNREKELTLILDRTTTERDIFRRKGDDVERKLAKSEAAAKKAKEELEALKNRSLEGIALAMVPLSVNVEECRSKSLALLGTLKTEKFWGQSAVIKDSGDIGATAYSSTRDRGIFLACSSFGDGSIVSISSASDTVEGWESVKKIHSSFAYIFNDPSLLLNF